MADDAPCGFINPLCPTDLCVLPAGHPGTPRNEHLLGTMYGSADPDLDGAPNPKYRERFSKRYSRMAPEGATVEQIVGLGWKMSRELFGDR